MLMFLIILRDYAVAFEAFEYTIDINYLSRNSSSVSYVMSSQWIFISSCFANTTQSGYIFLKILPLAEISILGRTTSIF